jgi:hypothetical protein
MASVTVLAVCVSLASALLFACLNVLHFLLTGRRLREPLPLGFRLGQIERRRQVLLRRIARSVPGSALQCSQEKALLRLEAREDRLLARQVQP